MKPAIQNLRIIHKCLLLVSIPLILETLFIIVLESQLQQTTRYRKDAERLYLISSTASKLSTDLMHLRLDAQLLRSNHSLATMNERKRDYFHVPAQIQLLEQQMNKIRSLQEQSSELASETLAIFEQLRLARAKAVNEAVFENADSRLLETPVEELLGRLNTVAERAAAGAAIASTGAKETEQTIQKSIALGLCANIVLLPILMLYLSQNIVQRLSILVSNSERFGRGEQLLPKLDGTDELSQLDRNFRDMAASITASREAEQQTRNEIEKLRREFTAMVGHDLRTPLNAVQATLTLIADGVYGRLSPDGVERAQTAEENINRLITLVNELLELDRLESGRMPIKLQPVNLDSVVARSIETVSGLAQFKNISIESTRTDATVLADEVRLLQILINLLSNALKFSPFDQVVSVSISTFGAKVRIAVSDSGPGIPAELQETIFERYCGSSRPSQAGGSGSGSGSGSGAPTGVETGSESKIGAGSAGTMTGHGLGLSIVRSLVIEHGGDIGFDTWCKDSSADITSGSTAIHTTGGSNPGHTSGGSTAAHTIGGSTAAHTIGGSTAAHTSGGRSPARTSGGSNSTHTSRCRTTTGTTFWFTLQAATEEVLPHLEKTLGA